ncbi:hypothetical protein DRQ36_04835 [bacterium]|nr:MAG: hypothetical protein DRQ36_04835 [bacterium]
MKVKSKMRYSDLFTERKKLRKRRISVYPLIATIVIITLIGCSGNDNRTSGADEIYVPVRIYEIDRTEVVKTLDFGAVLSPIQKAVIGPQFSAWVDKILVEEGQKVKKGELLVVLDDSQVRQVRAQYDAAKKEFERISALRKSGAVTQQQYDQVEAQYLAAKAGYELAGSNTNIRAPFDGVVSEITVEVGEAYSSMSMSPTGKPSLLSVLKTDSMKAEVRISDSQIERIDIGQRALVRVDNYPDTVFDGRVVNIEPAAEHSSGMFKAVIAIPNDRGLLKAGLYARVGIVIEYREKAIAVPQDAMVGDTLVFIARGRTARASRVTVDFETEDMVVVKSGIDSGDSVITDGVIGLFDGAEIRVLE